ncbi:choice-of-anchor K domain-containing protein [Streptomyces sp. NPDC093546]|uniref:lamin tail domain-containing protein n=1 Tax=Streptomyces sp. NPDC093546 TaxID=3366040 RepID=UPI0037FB73E0
MFTITTKGVWPKAIGADGYYLYDEGTDQIKWSGPSGNKSGYSFEGGTTEARLDGTEFTLGTFTHHNGWLDGNGVNEFDVDLKVNIVFDDGTTSDLSFRFHHNETDGDHNPDLVDLPSFISPETVKVDGAEYKVMISGFKQDGQIVRRFVSDEGGSNTADVVALFSRLPAKPDLVITDVRFKGTGKAQADEYVEFLNRGTEPADISGWKLGADDAGQNFTFPAGATVQPGHRIRVYTNENHPEWGGYTYGFNKAIWNNQGDVARLHDKSGKSVHAFPYGDKA